MTVVMVWVHEYQCMMKKRPLQNVEAVMGGVTLTPNWGVERNGYDSKEFREAGMLSVCASTCPVRRLGRGMFSTCGMLPLRQVRR
jgi:hypothetical protein